MGIRTTFYAMDRGIAARIADGDLGFPCNRACEIDKALPGLIHFTGLAPAAENQVIEIGEAEIVLYTLEQIDHLRKGMQPETLRTALDSAPADALSQQKIYPFDQGDTLADAWDYLSAHAETLVSFLSDAADENLAIVSVML